MQPIEIVKKILDEQYGALPQNKEGEAFAPSNIALCKYWGKRDVNLHLPVTSSLSVSLRDKGVQTRVTLSEENRDIIKLNRKVLEKNSVFAKRIVDFLNLFRDNLHCNLHFTVETFNNIPVGAGLASSAAGFAALVCALDKLFGWCLDKKQLSILARLGSGSACRSLWQGFVQWHAGSAEDGMDSFAECLPYNWPDLTLGLLTLSTEMKSVSSREAMQRTVNTSRYYKLWPDQVHDDLQSLITAIKQQDFNLLGKTAEANAMVMHGLMLTSRPAILYSTSETIAAIKQIWKLRSSGVNVYFTQDAGPNLILLFLKQDIAKIKQEFSQVEIVLPFK
ncbi:MAG: diphosphomevalonate decarboxylase [Gammaproteobacteria bacterium]|jgi:diphosphomevalonate decarboxylase